MQTTIHKSLRKHHGIDEAEKILRNCVHCGFCTATCPTYQLLGDELDGPRGRIYLIKQMLETGKSTADTQLHLDRCLTCRSCETTCPSGVEYGKLLAVGRSLSEKHAPRRLSATILRWLLRQFIPYRERMGTVVTIAQRLRKLFPASVQRQLPVESPVEPFNKRHDRFIIIPAGCAQSAFAPDINTDCRALLDRLGITAVEIDNDTCCGAMSEHMSQEAEAHRFMKQNIDSWWPSIENGAEAIISTASACGVMIKDYGRLLSRDPDYADKAIRVSELCKDISEYLQDQELGGLAVAQGKRVSFHAPCTLQHGQKITGLVESLLVSAGYELVEYDDKHLCCGSAGTYSILQRGISQKLLANKLEKLQENKPDIIATANIGCLLHMRSGTQTPVVHWLQLLAPARNAEQHDD